MPTFALSRGSLPTIKQVYGQRLRTAPDTIAANCRRMDQKFSGHKSADSIFANAADAYSSCVGHDSLFACFDHQTVSLEIGSANGALESRAGFHADTPNVLQTKTIGEDRLSVHVPSISGLDRRSLLQRISDTGGREIFGSKTIDVEYVSENKSETGSSFSSGIIGLLPKHFTLEEGAILLTPLGIEQSTPLGFGFFMEFMDNGIFLPVAIHQARTYSTFFTWQIISRILAGSPA